MRKNKLAKYMGITLLILGSVDIPIPERVQNETTPLSAGINGKQLQQGAKAAKGGWKWLKSCVGCKSEAEQVIKNKELEHLLENARRSNRLLVATEMLGKGIGEAKAQEDVLPKIGEYLSQTKPNEGGQKVINCVRTEANEVRMYLYEQGSNKPTRDKIIKAASEGINLAEYDVRAMQENFYKGSDGVEYVEFIIPRRAQYILNGQYSGRVYECMVFNIPKDINGNWEKFKEYLIAFLNDLMNRPTQLWDEYWFRRGLSELNIDSRDVKEMERYLFAQLINIFKGHDTSKFIQAKIA